MKKVQEDYYESEIEPEYKLGVQSGPRVAIKNPNFVDPGTETDNDYNKTHEMTREEVNFSKLKIQIDMSDAK